MVVIRDDEESVSSIVVQGRVTRERAEWRDDFFTGRYCPIPNNRARDRQLNFVQMPTERQRNGEMSEAMRVKRALPVWHSKSMNGGQLLIFEYGRNELDKYRNTARILRKRSFGKIKTKQECRPESYPPRHDTLPNPCSRTACPRLSLISTQSPQSEKAREHAKSRGSDTTSHAYGNGLLLAERGARA